MTHSNMRQIATRPGNTPTGVVPEVRLSIRQRPCPTADGDPDPCPVRKSRKRRHRRKWLRRTAKHELGTTPQPKHPRLPKPLEATSPLPVAHGGRRGAKRPTRGVTAHTTKTATATSATVSTTDVAITTSTTAIALPKNSQAPAHAPAPQSAAVISSTPCDTHTGTAQSAKYIQQSQLRRHDALPALRIKLPTVGKRDIQKNRVRIRSVALKVKMVPLKKRAYMRDSWKKLIDRNDPSHSQASMSDKDDSDDDDDNGDDNDNEDTRSGDASRDGESSGCSEDGNEDEDEDMDKDEDEDKDEECSDKDEDNEENNDEDDASVHTVSPGSDGTVVPRQARKGLLTAVRWHRAGVDDDALCDGSVQDGRGNKGRSAHS